MKKRIGISLVIILVLVISDCSKESSKKEKDKWDCTVAGVEESKENSYIIVYSEEKICSRKGKISIQNPNDFFITVHLSSDEEEECVIEVPGGGGIILCDVTKGVSYKVGLHADVEEGTEIECMIFDGEISEYDQL